MTASLETASKGELRLLCKANGVKGYGKMSNDQMRAALRAVRQPEAPARLTDTVPVKKVAKPRAKTEKSDAPSIREWLEARLAKGELKVDDALAYAEKSGRSKVTVYRQARELGYCARKGEFVKAKVRS